MGEKQQTLTILGRRDKQQILKDFVRPAPADVISSTPPTVIPGTGAPEGCAGPSGQPHGGGGAAWASDKDVECERKWNWSGVFSDPDGDTDLSPTWFLAPSRASIPDGALSGTPIVFPPMDAVGGLDPVLFGGTYSNWQVINAQLQSNCIPADAESESGIYGLITVDGDYASDPYVDYPVFGIGESDAYQQNMVISGLGPGTFPTLKYFPSDRHVYGTLATEIHGHPITEWVFDEWVVYNEIISEDRVVMERTGIKGKEIPYSQVLRTHPDTGIREYTVRIGDWEYKESPTGRDELDFLIRYERTVNWNVGVGASEHLIHFNAAYKGPIPAMNISFEGVHRFFPPPDEFEPLPSNTRKALPMENVETFTWNYPWQDILSVYNVWVDGILVQQDKWTWDSEEMVLTFNYVVPPDAFVLADSTVQ